MISTEMFIVKARFLIVNELADGLLNNTVTTILFFWQIARNNLNEFSDVD